MLVGFTACSDDSNDVDNNLDDTTDMTVTGEGSQVDGDSDSGVIVLDTTVAPGSPDSSPPPNSNAGAGGGDGNGSVTP